MKLYTALDVSLCSVAIWVVDEQGDVRHEAKVEADVDRTVACLRSLSPDLKVVGFEAGSLLGDSRRSIQRHSLVRRYRRADQDDFLAR